VVQDGPLIYVIDDNPHVTRGLGKVLESAGFKPVLCHRGSEALQKIKSQIPAAAIVDIHLPDISGLALTTTLRNLLGDSVPIIILSGDTSIATINALPHVGATYFFAKPVRGEYLVERVKEWLAEAESAV